VWCVQALVDGGMTPSRRPSLTHGQTAEDTAAVGQTVDAVAAMLATVAGGDADGTSSEAVGEVRIQNARSFRYPPPPASQPPPGCTLICVALHCVR
jgi:hypothetical protein